MKFLVRLSKIKKCYSRFLFNFYFWALLIIGNTFGVTSYKVVFNRTENTEIMKTCKTDEYGKLDNDCISSISTVCNRWSPEVYIYDGYVQKNQIAVSEFANMTFTDDTNYYCVAHSSLSGYKKGCYVCKDDSNIMKWKFNTSIDEIVRPVIVYHLLLPQKKIVSQ